MKRLLAILMILSIYAPLETWAQSDRVCVRWREETSMETRQFGTTITIVPVVRRVCVEWAERSKTKKQ